jgi:hypothetical protein
MFQVSNLPITVNTTVYIVPTQRRHQQSQPGFDLFGSPLLGRYLNLQHRVSTINRQKWVPMQPAFTCWKKFEFLSSTHLLVSIVQTLPWL